LRDYFHLLEKIILNFLLAERIVRTLKNILIF